MELLKPKAITSIHILIKKRRWNCTEYNKINKQSTHFQGLHFFSCKCKLMTFKMILFVLTT